MTTLIDNCDSLEKWQLSAATFSINTTNKIEGIGSIEGTTITGQWWLYLYRTNLNINTTFENHLKIGFNPAEVSPSHSVLVTTTLGKLKFTEKFTSQLVAGLWNDIDLDLTQPDLLEGELGGAITDIHMTLRNEGAIGGKKYLIDYARLESATPATLTIQVNDASIGTTNPSPGEITVFVGDTLATTALPNSGYQLDYWLLDTTNVGSTNPYSLRLDGNHTLTAIFKPIVTKHALSVDSAPIQGVEISILKVV